MHTCFGSSDVYQDSVKHLPSLANSAMTHANSLQPRERETWKTNAAKDHTSRQARTSRIDGPSNKRDMDTSVVNMFSTPVKRQRRARTQNNVAAAITAAELHKAVSYTKISSFVSFVLEVPDTDGIVSVYNKKTRMQEDVPLLTCLLADNTGPVHIDLWRDSVQSFRNIIFQHSSDSSLLLFRFTNLKLTSLSTTYRTCYPSCNKITATKKTTCEHLQQSSLPSVNPTSNSTFDRSLMLSNFDSLQKKLPFTANIRGIVAATESESESKSGIPMRSFKVHDNQGQYLRCIAFGRHVDNEIITVGNDIGIFFGTALRNYLSCFWLYDHAHVVHFDSGCTVLKETGSIDFTTMRTRKQRKQKTNATKTLQ